MRPLFQSERMKGNSYGVDLHVRPSRDPAAVGLPPQGPRTKRPGVATWARGDDAAIGPAVAVARWP